MSPLIVLSGLPVGFEWISFFCLYSIENICSFFFFSFFDSENICSLKHHIFVWSWSIFFLFTLYYFTIYMFQLIMIIHIHIWLTMSFILKQILWLLFFKIYIYIYTIWDQNPLIFIFINYLGEKMTLCSPNMFVPIVQFRPHFQEGT